MIDDASQTLARYQVITTLGQGGMARVLLTVSRGPAGVNKLLVVKELKAELKGDVEFVTMFLDEARIAARLNHPNVVQTYEVSSDGAHPIIVMEYLEGQSLSALLGRVGRKAMPLDLHVYILTQIAVGLHYAHELKSLDGTLLDLVHRDVSPHNTFVTYDGLVKLVDFGIAKAADSAGLTQAGQFKGKLGYASPEQLGANVEPFDRRADVFALGVMLWEALAGRRLTSGEPEGAIMNRRLRGKDPSVREAAPDAPEALLAICEKAMSFEPAHRFATAAEFRAALEAWLATVKRVGGEDVAALVSSSFAAEREKIRGIIETRVKELAASGEGANDFSPFSRRNVPLSSISGTSPSRVGRSGSDLPRPASSEPSDATMRASSAPSPLSTAQPPERRFGGTIIGVGAAVAIALTAVLVTRGGSSSATPTADAPSSSAPASAQAPAAAATVNVSISADPPEARVFLDDVALATNPFHGAMPKSPLAHRLRVTAPGFVPEERLVTLDRDLQLELSLKAQAGGTAPHEAPAAQYHPPAAGRGTATAAPAAAPGDGLNNSPHKPPPRTIDTAFP